MNQKGDIKGKWSTLFCIKNKSYKLNGVYTTNIILYIYYYKYIIYIIKYILCKNLLIKYFLIFEIIKRYYFKYIYIN